MPAATTAERRIGRQQLSSCWPRRTSTSARDRSIPIAGTTSRSTAAIEVPQTERSDRQRAVPLYERPAVQHHRLQRRRRRNGILFDPLAGRGHTPASARTAITVENNGGRNGAYGPDYAQMDARVGYRIRMAGARTLDVFGECSTSPTDRTSPTRRETGGCRTFSSTTAWSRAGSRGNCKFGTRLGFY